MKKFFLRLFAVLLTLFVFMVGTTFYLVNDDAYDEWPKAQKTFSNNADIVLDEYSSAVLDKNEVRVNSVVASAKTLFNEKMAVSGWIMKVDSVGFYNEKTSVMAHFGNITAKLHTDDEFVSQQFSRLYSGALIKVFGNAVGEASFTNKGMMEEPEIIFNVTAIDNNI